MNPFRVLRDTSGGRLRYVLRAWGIAVVPALALFFGLVAVGASTLRPATGMPGALAVAATLLLAPVIETALMIPLAALLARATGGRDGLAVAVLAALAALAHYPGGGWRQAANALWPFAVYAASLSAWRRRSAWDALVVTAAVHALYNATFLAVGALGALGGGVP